MSIDTATEFPIRTERVRANGLDFHVNACGEGDRLALCLHGFPEIGYSWRHQLPALAELGYQAWAPDLRGYGQSDRPKGLDAYAIEALMEDVAGLIDASGARSTILLVHDWGGMIGWHFATRKIRPLERLIVMNIPHPASGRRPSGQRRRTTLKQLGRMWYVLFFQLPWLPELALGARGYQMIDRTFRDIASDPAAFPEEVLAVYREAAARPGARTAMINYYRGLIRGGGFRRQAALGYPVIETPTLMLWGADDPVLVPSTTDGTDRFVKDLTLRFLPGVSHWVQQEAPETVNRLMSAWLRGEPVPEATAPGA